MPRTEEKEPGVVMEFKMHHVAISVKDIAESIRFYEILGFKVIQHWEDPEGTRQIAHLMLGSQLLEIFWYQHQVLAPRSSRSLETDLPRIGVKHFALEVDCLEEARDFVLSRALAPDVQIRTGKTGVSYFFIADPSDILIEFVEDKRDTRARSA